MDALFYYRSIEAVRQSLDGAGRHGFTLSRACDESRWFDLDWVVDFLDVVGYERVPLLWEGRPLPDFETLYVARDKDVPRIKRWRRSGVWIARGEAVIALVEAVDDHGLDQATLVVGERRSGALQQLLSEYDAYARLRAPRERDISVVGGDPIARPRGLTWDSLLLPPALRADLRRQVDGFFGAKEAYARMGIPYRRGILLTGPPGNGKTTVIRVIASQRPEAVVLLSSQEEIENYQLDEAFDTALRCAPSILCLEDVDTLFTGKVSLSYFLNRIDGLSGVEGVLIVATTNHPEELDEALTDRPSRFDRVYVFENPAPEERREYLRRNLGGAFHDELVSSTAGFSVAQLKEVWVSTCLEAIHEGSREPSREGAHRAVERLRGQKSSLRSDWQAAGPVGFQARRKLLQPPVDRQ